MSRAGSSMLVMACAWFANCSGPSENPLADGLTADHKALLIKLTIDEIESAENFTPDDFEQLQRRHVETMVEEMRNAALDYVQKRSGKVALLEMSQTVELDRESAEVESGNVGPEQAAALVTVNGSRTYSTSNASKTSKARFALGWEITVDDGELVFRHRGIRMRDTRD